MSGVASLGYLGLSVSNVEEWEPFSTDILGLQVSRRDSDGSLYLKMDEYHYRFALHPTGHDDLAYVGWEVPDEATLRAFASKLNDAGCGVTVGDEEALEQRRVIGLIKCLDPNGIPSEIFFGPLVTYDEPFRSPRGINGFITGEQGLGHFVIVVDDFEKSLVFYRDILGMQISDYVRMELAPGVRSNLVFLHCNPRHHSLAFLAAPVPQRLNHFMLQLRSLDDVGIAYDLCRERGVPIPGQWGRHTNDHMVSFYLKTPSGFNVEYGWGARDVDDATWQVQLHRKGSIWGHEGIYPTLPKNA